MVFAPIHLHYSNSIHGSIFPMNLLLCRPQIVSFRYGFLYNPLVSISLVPKMYLAALIAVFKEAVCNIFRRLCPETIFRVLQCLISIGMVELSQGLYEINLSSFFDNINDCPNLNEHVHRDIFPIKGIYLTHTDLSQQISNIPVPFLYEMTPGCSPYCIEAGLQLPPHSGFPQYTAVLFP